MNNIAILIVDDHPVFREGLRGLLTLMEGVGDVVEASTGEGAVHQAREFRPDVILMDIQMPGMNGIEATRQIHREVPDTPILMLTMVEDDSAVFDAIRAGARGYLLKTAEHDEILDAVRAVVRGEVVYSPTIARRLASYFAETRPAPVIAVSPELTARERQILRFLARERADREICELLGLSDRLLRREIASIYEKLQVTDRVAAKYRAQDAGMSS
jgi:DNA-binding NarL/FixJ family response regulator